MKKMFKKTLAVMLAMAMLLCAVPFTAAAKSYSGKCGDNLIWTLDTSTSMLEINGTGDMEDFSIYPSWYDYKESIKTVKIDDGVTTIGRFAFRDCYNIIKITIPESIISIGWCAFASCENLENISLPQSITSIDYGAFRECTSLKSINIPNGVKFIEGLTFHYCTSLKNVTISNTVTDIGYMAFSYCSNLKSISIPQNVSYIDDGAFWGCSSLESITVDNKNKYFSNDEYGVLYNKSKTELLQYPAGNTRTSYTISANVSDIKYPVSFYEATNLSKITIDKNNKYYSNDEIGVLFNKDKTEILRYPAANIQTKYTVPSSVTRISSYAFYRCSNLVNIELHDSIDYIDDYAFWGCTELKSMLLHEGIKEISWGMFGDCVNLKTIYLPASIEKIDQDAFYNCKKLTDIHYSGSQKDWNTIGIYDMSGIYDYGANIHYNSNTLKVMSYNVYVKNGTVTGVTNGKKYNCSYENRARYLVQNIHANMPDSFGLQEVTSELRTCIENYEDLNGGILKANYAGVGEYRSKSGSNNEASLIYYNKTKYSLKKSGTFWLSESGEKYSEHSGADYPRICTYALLENKETGYQYLHVNTHIEHDHSGDGGSNEAAIFSSKKIIEFIKDNYPGMPVVITGDFNQTSTSQPYKNFVNAGYTDARSIYTGNKLTYTNPFNQGSNGKAYTAKTIDHIFFNDYFEVSSYSVYDEDYTNASKYSNLTLDYPYPSDHHPVVVNLNVVKENSTKYEYNLGEETYSFENFEDLHAEGHCFGMAVTSAAYHLDLLDVSDIGLTSSSKLNTVKYSDRVKQPICHYQEIQGYYKSKAYVSKEEWSKAINYVKDHNFDNTGSLLVDIWCFDDYEQEWYGHTVNFLYYKNVNGQDRIYVYDNNFPDTETYFYRDSNGNILQAPYSTFYECIDEIYLVDMQTYFTAAKKYNSKKVIYSESKNIAINGVTGTPMSGTGKDSTRYMFEIPEDKNEVIITPLVDNATFTYLDETYDFENIDGAALLKLANDDEVASAELSSYYPEIEIKSPSTTTINYGDTLVLHAGVEELPAGYSILWTVEGNGVTIQPSEDGLTCSVTSVQTGNVTVKATVVDENGEAVLDIDGNEFSAEQQLKSNVTFWQKIVSFFKNLFGISRMILQAA